MKIFTNPINENWVVDNVVNEWIEFQKELTTKNIRKADIVWIIAPWTWKKLSKIQITKKIVICTIHHIDFDKFDEKDRKDFYERDKYVDYYHTVSEKSCDQLRFLTNKKVYVIPFWVNQDNFYDIDDKNFLRNKYKILENSYVVGSFQRDTEGHDLKSPKLSKW